MHSPRVLGVVALAAIVVAAVSFAVVDVTIADGCVAKSCDTGIPLVAISFAALGALAALVSIVPAVGWIVEAIRDARRPSPEHDRELARAARARRYPAPRRRHTVAANRRVPRARPAFSVETADGENAHDGDSLFGRRREVDLGGDRPVVMSGRVVEDLPHDPESDPIGGFLVDHETREAAGIRRRADRVMFGEVGVERFRPLERRGRGRPTRHRAAGRQAARVSTGRCARAPGTLADS